jgi:hypothetical protein
MIRIITSTAPQDFSQRKLAIPFWVWPYGRIIFRTLSIAALQETSHVDIDCCIR